LALIAQRESFEANKVLGERLDISGGGCGDVMAAPIHLTQVLVFFNSPKGVVLDSTAKRRLARRATC